MNQQKKSVKYIKYIYNFRFFKVATLCLDYSFTHSWHSQPASPGKLPQQSKEFPHMLSTCWLLFLYSAVQLIPNHLNWVVEARSPDAKLHHAPSWSNSPYTAWRCVGSLSC
jgi:hypothetical protein